MKGLLIILLVLGISPVKAQVSLNLEKCREMALESSKKMSIATKQGEKAEFERKAYRANFLPKLSATGLYAYMQKKSSFTIDGGIYQRSCRMQTGSWFTIFILIRRRNFQ